MARLILMLTLMISAPAFAVACGYNSADVFIEFLARPVVAALVVVLISLWFSPSSLKLDSEERGWKADAFFFTLFLAAYGYVLFELHRHAPLRFGWFAMATAIAVEFSVAGLWLQKKPQTSSSRQASTTGEP